MTMLTLFWVTYAASALVSTLWTLQTWARVHSLELFAPVSLLDELHPLTRPYVAFSPKQRSAVVIVPPPEKQLWKVLGWGLVPGVPQFAVLALLGTVGYLAVRVFFELRKPDSEASTGS